MRWLIRTLRILRTWLWVRLGLWRGRWRRGRVQVSGVPLLGGALAVRAWNYGLYAPAGLHDAEAAPLIVLLHGCHQRALNFAYASGWTRLADRWRLRLLCPDQRRVANLLRCWNWFTPSAQLGRGEQVLVLRAIEQASQQVQVLPQRIAVVGLSAGGALAALLAFHHPERFFAAVVVAGPPLLGVTAMQSPQDVMRRGLRLAPELALGTRRQACTRLAVLHGAADPVVAPVCATQLLQQAVASQARAGRTLTQRDAGVTGGGVDYYAGDALWLRRIELPALAHAWTGGPGGHAYCHAEGPPLTRLCGEFLSGAGLLQPAATAAA